MSQTSEDIGARLLRLERRAERERAARLAAESLLEAKSRELYTANQLLSRLAADLEMRVCDRTQELAAAREQALELAERDQLTGLANRACFSRVLDASIAGSQASGQRFALLLIDLDRFKEINDALGHEAGDVFLRHVAAQLRSVSQRADIVARLGGDEFAVILRTDGRPAELHRIAEAMIAAVQVPIAYRDRALEASGSVGVALFPDDAVTASELQRFADIALYRSKVARSTHTLYDPAMGRELEARQSLGAELARAIRTGDIRAWFQPIVDGASSRAVGVEALARWRHPTRGFISPAQFLDLAEERGLMHDLFACMMRSACPPAKRWIEAGAISSLSINLSPSQFKLGALADDVLALLRELDFPPDRLTVEITEEVLMHDLDRARSQLDRLATLGVRVALDDFGVGYSNVAYLRRLPIHTLKLDRSLTADVTSERAARSILGALVELARALDLELVAEGIEEQGQALWLTHLGCRNLQGYLFGKPMDAAAFEREIGAEPGRPLSPSAASRDRRWLA